MLNIEKVNLYDHYGLEKLPERAGNLTCIYFSTGREISTSRVRPAVLIMPGGGYHAVSDREAEPIALRFANRGYAAFVLRYSVEYVEVDNICACTLLSTIKRLKK